MNVVVVGCDCQEVTDACKMVAASGTNIRHVELTNDAMAILRSGDTIDFLLVDVDIDIDSFARSLEQERIFVPIIAYGVDTDARIAVRAVKSGALDFLPLPPDSDLIAAIFSSISSDQSGFICEDEKTREVLSIAKRVAPSDATILITGESGTGKEMVARFVHMHSRRHTKELISVNCAAIPDNLLESELFGHEKGAFTGANARRIGKFEEADGGTLLLDEIGEMDPRLQAKLLRAIQEREIDRVGGTRPIKVDIRVLATTNRDLAAEVRAGRFREDLLFRLNVVQIKLPPLRKRPGDLVPLSKIFVERFTASNKIMAKRLDRTAIARLLHYQWPGNVRELENCIHRAVLLSKGETIGSEDITFSDDRANHFETANNNDNEDLRLVGKSVAEVEKRLIVDTLAHTLGNRTRAATILGISIRTLRNKLKQYSDEGMAIPSSVAGTIDAAVGRV